MMVFAMMDKQDRRFLLGGYGVLAVLFLFSLLQNYLRYGIHETYNVWRSVVYLLICYVLFLPLWWGFHFCLRRVAGQRYRWGVLAGLVLGVAGSFYVLSGIGLFLAGFYEEVLSLDYLRSYSGRYLLFHLLAMAGSVWFAFRRKPEKEESPAPPAITATLGRREVQILADQVRWMEADDHYLRIHTDTETYLKRITLEKMCEVLEPDFIRIHRKYLVQRAAIVGKERKQRDEYIILHDGRRLRVGRSYQPLSW